MMCEGMQYFCFGPDASIWAGRFEGAAALTIQGLSIVDEPWVRCAGDQSPLVKITKHPTEDKYRVLVTCPPDNRPLTQ